MGRPKTIEDSALLAIAREVFRQHGHTATTRHVAEAAGVSQAVLYQRFRTKDALFLAALTHHAVSLQALSAIDPALAPRPYLAAFAARAKDHFRQAMPSILSHAAHPKYGKEMMGQIHRHNRAGEIALMLGQRVEAWQRAGLVRPLAPRVFAHAFIHALHSMAMVEVLSGDDVTTPTKPADLAELVGLFWEGLRPASSGRKRSSRRPR